MKRSSRLELVVVLLSAFGANATHASDTDPPAGDPLLADVLLVDVAEDRGDGELATEHEHPFEFDQFPTIDEGQPADSPIQADASAAIQEHCNEFSPELVDVFIHLRDVDSFDFRSLEGSKDQLRESLIADRQMQVFPQQEEAAAMLEQVGASEVGFFWLVNGVSAKIPCSSISTLAGLEFIELIEPAIEQPEPALGYTGYEARIGLRTGLMHSAGYRGDSGSRSGGDIRVGIIEVGSYFDESSGQTITNHLASDHVGWKDTAGGATRIVSKLDCTSTTCTSSATLPTVATHATQVAWVAAGSIEEGQDAAVTSTLARQFRSGIAREAAIYYSRLTGTNNTNIIRAMERMVGDGVDVVNMSLFYTTYQCSASSGIAGFNTALQNAADAGVVLVGSAGNDGHVTCTIEYPSSRPEVLSVGGVNTTDLNTSYQQTFMSDFSARGPFSYTMADGSSGNSAGVDLVAPYDWSHNFTVGPQSYATSTTIGGTSFSGPAVAGAAALLRDAFSSLSFSAASDARLIHANMILQGDRWDGSSNPNARQAIGVSSLSGSGRLRMYYPSSSSLTAPWKWMTFVAYVTNGSEVSFNPAFDGVNPDALLPSTVSELKVVAEHFVVPTGIGTVPKFTLEITDTIRPPGAIPFSRVDSSTDTVKVIDVRASGNLIDRRMKVTIKNVVLPAGVTSMQVYVAFRWHSGADD